jgi:HK97 family phage major capsid protein
MNIREIREAAAAEAEAAREIVDKAEQEGRNLTAEEAADVDKHSAKAEEYIKLAERKERLEQCETNLNEAQLPKVPKETATGERIEVPGPKLKHYGSLIAFKGPNAKEEAYRSGRFLAAVVFNHAPSRQWCREHGVEIRKEEAETETRVMNEASNVAGGFTVPDEFENSIIDLREQYGDARRECRIKVMGSDHSNEPKKTGGLTAYPVGENTALTESEQTWGNVELTAKKWGVLVRISSELSEDSIVNLADDLAQDGALAFATAEDTACIDGNGTSTYHGLIGIRTLMIDGSHTGSYYDPTSGCDEWADVTDAILTQVMGQLPKYAQRGAKWHCSPRAKAGVFDRLLRAASGNTNINLAEGQPARYNGYPIVEWPAMPTDDTSAALNDKIMLMFGNMNMSSKMGVRRGITVLPLYERYAEYDQIGIRMTERYTINHHTITGATSTTAGPIVGLLGGT